MPYWENGNYKRHVELDRKDNVATITLSPGYKQFEAFCSEADLDGPMDNPIALPSGIISDDEDDGPATGQPTWSRAWETPQDVPRTHTPTTTTVDFDLNGPPKKTASEERITPQM